MMKRNDKLENQKSVGVRAAWSQYLERFHWDTWMTLTPRFQECSAERLHSEVVNGFIRRLAFMSKSRCPWVGVIERSPAGTFHEHLLVSGTKELSLSQIRSAWTFGQSHVSRYQQGRGAASYLSKTLGDLEGHWEKFDCSRRMPPLAGRSVNKNAGLDN